MKNFLFRFFGFFGLIVFLTSCEKNDEIGDLNDLSAEARSFFGVKSGAEAMNSNRSGNIANGNMEMLRSYSTSVSAGEDGDSVVLDWPGQWETCAMVSQIQNEDGSTTSIRDYGDGCYEGWGDWQYLIYGKVIDTYKYDFNYSNSTYQSDYLYESEYIGHGGSYQIDEDTLNWEYDGYSRSSGSSSYDTLSNKYEGLYLSDYSLTYQSNDISYGYEGNGEFLYDNEMSTTPRNSYKFSEGENFYQSEVTKPLIFKYNCQSNLQEDMMFYIVTYVSGEEVITYSQNGKQGQFKIEYGNGECDNIVFITENGMRIKVDLSDLYMTNLKG